jgi:hypothetical protein
MSRAGHSPLAVGVGEQLEGDWRDEDRHGELGAEDGGPGRHLGDVDQHPRSQLPALERLGVAAQRALVAGPSGEVGVRPRLEPLEGQALEIGDVDGLGDAARLFPWPIGLNDDLRSK